MRAWLASLAILLVGCGQGAAIAARSPASVTPSAIASPTSPLEAPSPSASNASPGPATASPTPSSVAVPVSPGGRSLAAAAYDQSRSAVVIFGGLGKPSATSANYLGDTWTSTSAGWHQMSTTGPSPRFAASMAYDVARGVVVLFGGLTESDDSDETWTWDGRSWSQQHPAVSPPGRQDASMAYDMAQQVIVLFGGQTNPTRVAGAPQLNDTWVWDGVSWQQRHPTSGPSARVFAPMAYDGARKRIVLFGGSSGQGQTYDGGFGDTWTWDGQAWTQFMPVTSPPPRSVAAMAFDETRGVTVLFGGVSGKQNTVLSDTWTWDGVNWKQQQPTASPPPRVGHVMAYDSARRVVLLQGGEFDAPLGDAWLWDGRSWAPAA
jgi:hypothetical protein